MPRFGTPPIIPARILSEYREGETPAEPQGDENSMFFAGQQELCPPGLPVAIAADEASPEIIFPGLDSNIVPAQDDTISVDQTPSSPSGAAFASDRLFVRENPW